MNQMSHMKGENPFELYPFYVIKWDGCNYQEIGYHDLMARGWQENLDPLEMQWEIWLNRTHYLPNECERNFIFILVQLDYFGNQKEDSVVDP